MRIIAGTAKGRRLHPPTNRNIRPTSDRVRESLFNMLMPHIVGARFLDLYCGSGAVGIEALSRGAAHCTFIDNDDKSMQITKRNLELCKLAVDASLIRTDIPDKLTPQPNPYSIVFADPPYAFNRHEEFLTLLQKYNYIAENGLVILETSIKTLLPDIVDSLAQQKRRLYGDTALTFFS